MTGTPTVPATVAVQVESGWWSKINWTQAVSFAASALVVLTGGKLNIPIEIQGSIVLGIQAVQSIATWIMKTWFTKTVTPASVANATTTTTIPTTIAHIT